MGLLISRSREGWRKLLTSLLTTSSKSKITSAQPLLLLLLFGRGRNADESTNQCPFGRDQRSLHRRYNWIYYWYIPGQKTTSHGRNSFEREKNHYKKKFCTMYKLSRTFLRETDAHCLQTPHPQTVEVGERSPYFHSVFSGHQISKPIYIFVQSLLHACGRHLSHVTYLSHTTTNTDCYPTQPSETHDSETIATGL